jgi:hypothetical protein
LLPVNKTVETTVTWTSVVCLDVKTDHRQNICLLNELRDDGGVLVHKEVDDEENQQ